MLLSLYIFINYVNRETIEYYVLHNEKDKAIQLLKDVLQREPDDFESLEKYEEYYVKKYNEKKEFGELYTGQLPSLKQR